MFETLFIITAHLQHLAILRYINSLNNNNNNNNDDDDDDDDDDDNNNNNNKRH